jgi:two-component system, NarL family, response regulator NreC
MTIRVLVADDHTIVRQGVVSLLQASGDCTVVGEASDGVEAVEQAVATTPDVVVLDIGMPRLSGLEAVRRIRQEVPRARVLVLTMHEEEEYVVHLVKAGASGYLVKDSAAGELLAAVRALARGQGYLGPYAARVLAEQYRRPEEAADPYGTLTPREREVFHLVIDGKTTKEIARQLAISPKTAENHRARLMDKLGVHNTAELVRYAARKRLLP